MIGHMALRRYWDESRQRAQWTRELSSLRQLEPSSTAFRSAEVEADRRRRPAHSVARKSAPAAQRDLAG